MRAADISRGRQILARFLALAEERLAYLIGLYETGRWTRYFTQTELLDNVRDAKTAVDSWKLLVSTEALPSNRPVDLDWLNHGRPLPSRRHLLPDAAHPPLPSRVPEPVPVLKSASLKSASLKSASLETAAFKAMETEAAAFKAPSAVAEPIRIKQPMTMAAVRGAKLPSPAPVIAVVPKPAAELPTPPAWQNALDFALMRERYPLLRKTG